MTADGGEHRPQRRCHSKENNKNANKKKANLWFYDFT